MILLQRLKPLPALCCVAVACWLIGCQVLFGDVKIGDSPAGTGQCQAGDFRCNGEFLLSCAPSSSDWVLKDTCSSGANCNPKAAQCTVCKSGDNRCSGADIQQCKPDGSGWSKVTTCDSEAQCNGTGCGPCVAGSYDCAGDPQQQLRKCNDAGAWEVQETCANAALCASSVDMSMSNMQWDGHCVAAGCDPPGKYQCSADGMRLQHCPPDQTQWADVDTCPSPAVCAQVAQTANSATDQTAAVLDSCKGGCPVAGIFTCDGADGANLEQCNPDLTALVLVKTCPAGTECNPLIGDCGQPCQPGTFQCNGAVLRQCQSDRTWKDQATCKSTALCTAAADGSSGSCTDPACTAGEFKCDGVTLKKCQDDLTGFQTVDTCLSAALCNATSQRCDPAACTTPNALNCNGQELQQCKADLTQLVSITTCAAGQYCDTDLTSPCKLSCPTKQRCNGRVLENCTPGGWTTQATCSTNDLCTCTLTDPDGAGPLTNSCLLGIFTDGCGNVVCGGSKAGYQCVGSELEKCQAGRNGWDPVTDCKSADLCYPGAAPTYSAGYCATCPTAGELYCMGSVLDVCSADRRAWNVSDKCTSYGCIAVQNGNDYCAKCAKGSVACSGATLNQCSSDQKKLNPTACASAALCDAKNAECDRCVANSVSCDGATLVRCSADGQSQTSTACATPDLCDATNNRCITPKCAVGQTQCIGAQPQVCNKARNGWDNSGMACATAGLCDSNKHTCNSAVCNVGDERCVGTQLQGCNSDRTDWTKLDTCATTQLCAATQAAAQITCKPAICAPGDRQCSTAGQPQVCNTGRTGYSDSGTACGSAALCSAGSCLSCVPGTFQCGGASGAQPQKCSASGTWANTGPTGGCGSAALCVGATGTCITPTCAAGATRCTTAGQPQQCNSDRTAWVNTTAAPCASAALCNAATATCTTQGCPVAGMPRCLGAQPQMCSNDLTAWVNTTAKPCATPALCDPVALCTDPVCQPMQLTCDAAGIQPEVCNIDQTGWDPSGMPCPTACTGEGVCTP